MGGCHHVLRFALGDDLAVAEQNHFITVIGCQGQIVQYHHRADIFVALIALDVLHQLVLVLDVEVVVGFV